MENKDIAPLVVAGLPLAIELIKSGTELYMVFMADRSTSAAVKEQYASMTAAVMLTRSLANDAADRIIAGGPPTEAVTRTKRKGRGA